MSWRNQLGSYLVISFVSALIWLWAAGETRRSESVISQVIFVVQGDDTWIIEPNVHAFRMIVEGSQLAIQNVQRLARDGFTINLTPNVGAQSLDIEQALREHSDFRDTGAQLIEIDRPVTMLAIDRLVDISLPVVPNLPGVQTAEAQPLVDPASITLSLPSLVQAQYSDLRVQAFVGQELSATLPEGVPQQLVVNLRLLPDSVAARDYVSLNPSTARISFTIRSQMREITLDQQINVQLAGPWEDQKDYMVEFDTANLRDVTIRANAELIRQIEAGEATIFAVVHLPSKEKERIAGTGGSASKPVSLFLAMIDDVGHEVEVRINGSDQPPMIELRVTAAQPSPSE